MTRITNRNDLFQQQHSQVKNGKCMKQKVGHTKLYCAETTYELQQMCRYFYLELYRRCYDNYDPQNNQATPQHTAPTHHINPALFVKEYPVPWLQGQGIRMIYPSEIGQL
jgi:hypothetical protein